METHDMIYELRLNPASSTPTFLRHSLPDILKALGAALGVRTPAHAPAFFSEAVARANERGLAPSLSLRAPGTTYSLPCDLALAADAMASAEAVAALEASFKTAA